MGKSVFIVGAGFSLAANAKFKSSDQKFAKLYPLASDLGIECFGASWDIAGDVETAFSVAVHKKNCDPIKKLVKLIQTADYYLGSQEAKDPLSVYARLLEQFPNAQFVSFNYDSLLEQGLLHRRQWNPSDDFGVPVETGHPNQVAGQFEKSKVLVIHLHGSILLYPVEFFYHRKKPIDHTLWMTHMDEPEFRFDPYNLGDCFEPFKHAPRSLDYKYPDDRVIVPLRDKSDALRENYIQMVYNRACNLLQAAEQVIAIGYRFAECDRLSFEPLLEVIMKKQLPLLIVAPDACDIATELGKLYTGLAIQAVSLTLEEWAESNFQLVRQSS